MSAAAESGAQATGAQREMLRRQYRTRARRMRPFYLLLLISFAFLASTHYSGQRQQDSGVVMR